MRALSTDPDIKLFLPNTFPSFPSHLGSELDVCFGQLVGSMGKDEATVKNIYFLYLRCRWEGAAASLCLYQDKRL